MGQVERSGGEARFYPSIFVPGAFRGDSHLKEVPHGAKVLGFNFDLTEAEQRYPQFAYRVLSETGKSIRSGSMAAPAPMTSELNMVLPIAGLPPGVYTFVFSGVAGGNQTQLRRTQFRIQP